MKIDSKSSSWKRTPLVGFVATDSNHRVEGFKSGGENRLRENDCELHTICLVEDYQGKQIGSKLIKKLTEALDKQNYHKMIVQVLTGNAAKKFYEKTGAKYLDSSRISILGKVLEKSVYSWENIKQIMNSK
ncbi:N-acetyltransferase family protein [Marinilactibacillus psychrotolerans]|nr:GNAT family N-acetyltransferase [Marinilactibacillus psychrotolerans]